MLEMILDYAKQFGDKIGLFIEDYETGEKIEFHPDTSFSSASLIKYPVLWSLMEQVEQGAIDLNETHLLTPEDKAGSSPFDSSVLRELHDGIPLTLEDCAKFMIVISDDTATNIIMQKVSFARMNAAFEELGLTGTRAGRLMMDYAGLEAGRDNFVSAGDMARLSHSICFNEKLSSETNQKMLTILKNQRHNDGINKNYPMEVRMAHKGGCIRQYQIDHDCGVIFKDDKPRVSVNVCTRYLPNARNVINRIGDMVYARIFC